MSYIKGNRERQQPLLFRTYVPLIYLDCAAMAKKDGNDSYSPFGAKILDQMHHIVDLTREQWEKETNALQREFFSLKPGETLFESKGGDTDRVRNDGANAPMGDMNVAGVSVDADELTTSFKARLEMSGFSERDISINIKNNKLIVYAKHDIFQKGKNVSKEFSRQIEIPKFVDDDTLKCALGRDGILEIEAMPRESHLGQGQSSRSPEHGIETHILKDDNGHLSNSDLTHLLQTMELQSKLGYPSASPNTRKCLNVSNNKAIPDLNAETSTQNRQGESRTLRIHQDGVERVKLIVDIGSVFKPDDVKIATMNNKLFIIAKHEENQSDLKKCKKEYSKEFEIPENLDLSSITASVSVDGKVIVRANTFI